MRRIIISIFSTTVLIYIVPFAVYALFSIAFGLSPSAGVSPAQFLFSILISKIGTAIAISLLYYHSKEYFHRKWVIYAAIWWTMFVIGEVGQAFGPNYSLTEAIAGIISETIYIPVSVVFLRSIFK